MLIPAAKVGDADMCRRIATASNVVEVDDEGMTALHYAASLGHLETVQALIGAGAAVEAKDNYGRTAIFLACDTSSIDVAKWLVRQSGARVNLVDNVHLQTPIHHVCYNGPERRSQFSVPLLEWLVKSQGEEIAIEEDKYGQTVDEVLATKSSHRTMHSLVNDWRASHGAERCPTAAAVSPPAQADSEEEEPPHQLLLRKASASRRRSYEPDKFRSTSLFGVPAEDLGIKDDPTIIRRSSRQRLVDSSSSEKSVSPTTRKSSFVRALPVIAASPRNEESMWCSPSSRNSVEVPEPKGALPPSLTERASMEGQQDSKKLSNQLATATQEEKGTELAMDAEKVVEESQEETGSEQESVLVDVSVKSTNPADDEKVLGANPESGVCKVGPVKPELGAVHPAHEDRKQQAPGGGVPVLGTSSVKDLGKSPATVGSPYAATEPPTPTFSVGLQQKTPVRNVPVSAGCECIIS
jgi:hypothetical protein